MGDNRPPTMKDVADLAGVALSTVSHVINGTRFVREETREKVEGAIEQLGFRTNLVARNLRSGKSNLIGFAVSNLSAYFYVNIARGIQSVIGPQGYHLALLDSQENRETEMQNIEALYDRSVDGLILTPTTSSVLHLNRVVSGSSPVVFVDRQPSDFEGDSVLLSNTDAGYRATRHLIDKGHVDIAFVGFHFGHGEIDRTMRERITGYEQAHEAAGLTADPDRIRVTAGTSASTTELKYAEPYHSMKSLLKEKVTAVLCGNSLAAVGVFSCLKEQSVRIPDEVALVTFDDELWLSMCSPSITVMAQPAELMGASAARRLLKRLENRDLPYESFRLKADLLLRDSS
ncbi:MAG: LacI family DNA-binding transcriptional regulator [Spirochaetia bacterium]